MDYRPANAITLPALLLFLTAITLVMAMVRMVQIPSGSTSSDVAHLMTVPVWYWLHAASGVAFGLIGPVQFGRAIAKRYGYWHRILGRLFVAAGLVLGLSGLRLIAGFHGSSTPVLDFARMLGGLSLLVALWLALRAAMTKRIAQHKRWIIRAYAIGMGQSLVAFVLFPIYLITGEPPIGLAADLTVVGSWLTALVAAEWVIRRNARITQPV